MPPKIKKIKKLKILVIQYKKITLQNIPNYILVFMKIY